MLERLTEEQAGCLEVIQHELRVAISGAAGTGKTILALVEAARQAKGGRRVLFVCFNRALAAWAQRGLEGKGKKGILRGPHLPQFVRANGNPRKTRIIVGCGPESVMV